MKRYLSFAISLAAALTLAACDEGETEGYDDEWTPPAPFEWAETNVDDIWYTQYGAQRACPEGWRLPSVDHFLALENDENVTGEWVSSPAGYRYTDSETGATVFFPANGESVKGTVEYKGYKGCYWTSTVLLGAPWGFLFITDGNDESAAPITFNPDNGLSVRCIRNLE